MDWNFIKEEVLELLDGFGINDSCTTGLEGWCEKFVEGVSRRYEEQEENDENGTDSEWQDL